MQEEGIAMQRKTRMIKNIILAVLLICTVCIIYSIVRDPFGEHDMLFAIAVTAGFIVLGKDKEKESKI